MRSIADRVSALLEGGGSRRSKAARQDMMDAVSSKRKPSSASPRVMDQRRADNRVDRQSRNVDKLATRKPGGLLQHSQYWRGMGMGKDNLRKSLLRKMNGESKSESVSFPELTAECRFHMLESALRDIIGRMSNQDLAREISDPEVHDAGAAYHAHLAKATDSDAKREMHQTRAKAHSSAAAIIRTSKKYGRRGDDSVNVTTSNARAVK